MADPTRELGYEYTVALVDAIEAVVANSPRRQFVYRGDDLSRAIECVLYIALVNDDDLYAAFRANRRGDDRVPSRQPTELGSRIAQRMLGERRGAFSELGARSRWVAQDLRYAARTLATRRDQADHGSVSSEVCFCVGAPKMLRFIAPVVDALGGDDVTVVGLRSELDKAIRDYDYAYVSVPQRDAPEGRVIGAALREWPHLLSVYDGILEVLGRRRPACAVVVEGGSPGDELVNRACVSLGIPCVCLQQGWSPIVHNGFRGMRFTRMALWGEGFRGILAPYNPEQPFEIAGNLALAGTVDSDSGTLDGSGQAVSFFLQPQSPLIGTHHQRLLRTLIEHTTASLPDVTALVREHPGDPLGPAERQRLLGIPNVRLVPPGSYGLAEVIRASRAAVSIYSSSLLEAAALGTPALVFNPTSLPRYSPDLEALGVGAEVDGVEAGVRALTQFARDEAYRQSLQPAFADFRNRFFAGADNRAPERLAALIREVGRHGPSQVGRGSQARETERSV